MRLTSFHDVGSHRERPRIWLESGRLSSLGFAPDTPLTVTITPSGLSLRPASHLPPPAHGFRAKVSRRTVAGEIRPLIELNSVGVADHFSAYEQVRIAGTYGLLTIARSIRAANLALGRRNKSVYRILDVFCGGGTASDAFTNPRFKVVAGIEKEAAYADEFARKHPDAEIIIGDFRKMHPAEIPDCDGMFLGIPCTCHSNQGRAKKQLRGKPELGDVGDMFIPALGLIAAKLPSFVVLENVPQFGSSTGLTCVSYLRHLGYDVTYTNIDPLDDYAEPSTRRRWLAIATLKPGFSIPNPHTPFTGTIGDYLDPEDDEQDRADAARIANTVAGLKRHNVRHAALGHRFPFKVVSRQDTSLPTIQKSYHKINGSGAFVATPHGERMIRPAELCRIHGHSFTTTNAKTVYQMSGQGVQTRVLRTIFDALAAFLP